MYDVVYGLLKCSEFKAAIQLKLMTMQNRCLACRFAMNWLLFGMNVEKKRKKYLDFEPSFAATVCFYSMCVTTCCHR